MSKLAQCRELLKQHNYCFEVITEDNTVTLCVPDNIRYKLTIYEDYIVTQLDDEEPSIVNIPKCCIRPYILAMTSRLCGIIGYNTSLVEYYNNQDISSELALQLDLDEEEIAREKYLLMLYQASVKFHTIEVLEHIADCLGVGSEFYILEYALGFLSNSSAGDSV